MVRLLQNEISHYRRDSIYEPTKYYTKPSITKLEVDYATDAATNGWGSNCYDYINKFERQ